MLDIKYIDVADKIVQLINNKEWSEKLPGVSKLSVKMEVDPKTVNKAVHYLSQKNIVKVIPKSGTWLVK